MMKKNRIRKWNGKTENEKKKWVHRINEENESKSQENKHFFKGKVKFGTNGLNEKKKQPRNWFLKECGNNIWKK